MRRMHKRSSKMTLQVPQRFLDIIKPKFDPGKPTLEQGVFDAELEAFVFFLLNGVTVDVTHIKDGQWSISVNDDVDCYFDSKGFKDDEESAGRLQMLINPEYVTL